MSLAPLGGFLPRFFVLNFEIIFLLSFFLAMLPKNDFKSVGGEEKEALIGSVLNANVWYVFFVPFRTVLSSEAIVKREKGKIATFR